MVIKNGQALIQRADEHREADRMLQGEYGIGYLTDEGEFKWQGCAIGCLSTPANLEQLKEHMSETALSKGRSESGAVVASVTHFDDRTHFSFSDHWQLSTLEKEFGICTVLMRHAEGVFEGTHAGRGEAFIPKFARAVAKCEGIDITNDMVEQKFASTTNNEKNLLEWLGCLAENMPKAVVPDLLGLPAGEAQIACSPNGCS